MTSLSMILLTLTLTLMVLAILWKVGVYNRPISSRNGFQNAFAQIDVQLKRRYDLIPNLVKTAKGHIKHEPQRKVLRPSIGRVTRLMARR